MGSKIVLGDRITMGKRVQIGSFVVIENDVWIGDGVVIENFVEIMAGTVIRANCLIRSFTRLGPRTDLGQDVIVKCSAITGPETSIAKGAFIGPQSIFFSNVESGIGGSYIGKKAFIGGGARVMPGLRIGNYAQVGASSFVNCNIPARETWVGIPARKVK